MMEELQLDKSSVSTLMPFPGTALFKQVVKDKLFINDMNLDELWKTPMDLDQYKFLIKPYNMSVDDLYKWRNKFDSIRVKFWKINPERAQLGLNLSLNEEGVAPRHNY